MTKEIDTSKLVPMSCDVCRSLNFVILFDEVDGKYQLKGFQCADFSCRIFIPVDSITNDKEGDNE